MRRELGLYYDNNKITKLLIAVGVGIVAAVGVILFVKLRNRK